MKMLDAIKESLRKNLSFGDKAILFGSRARGTARPDSDWDILIIRNKERLETCDYDGICYHLREIGWDYDQYVEPIMYTAANWEKQRITPFYKNVTQDGISLL